MSPSTGVLADEVAGVPAPDAGGLHAPIRGEVRRSEREALHPGRREADLLDVGDAAGGLEDGVQQDRPRQSGAGLELRDQAVGVVDVLGALDLREHDDVEHVPDLGDEGRQVVEHPRRVERVDPRPQLGLAHVDGLADLDQPVASRLLAVGLDRVLEVAQQDVHLRGDVGHLADHLLVRRVEEVDHPRGTERDLAHRFGRADRQRLEDVLRAAHRGAFRGVTAFRER
jgi:hypothetical protein